MAIHIYLLAFTKQAKAALLASSTHPSNISKKTVNNSLQPTTSLAPLINVYI
jgi:hypothetical protein